jgi:hypothetical protein
VVQSSTAETSDPHTSVIAAGSGFVDDGGDVTSSAREGSVYAVVDVTEPVPKGAPRADRRASPGNFPF